MRVPFYYKVGQPLRGVVACAVVAVMGVLTYLILASWWAPWGDKSYVMLTLYLLCVLDWIFLVGMHFANWPFTKISQPLQGVLASALCLLLGYITYFILFDVLGWAAHIFPIGVAWLLLIYVFGPWSDFPITSAYGGKQPITGISASVTTLGFALTIWWIIPEKFLGIATGFPFVWFLVGCWFGFTWGLWPFQVKMPQRLIIMLGYVTFFSFVYLGILAAARMNFLAAPGDPEFSRGPTFLCTYIVALLIPVGLFQNWPIHRLPVVRRGFITIVYTLIIGVLVYWLLYIIGHGDPVFLQKVLSVEFCLLMGYFFYYTNWGGALAPPPGASSHQ
jgi:hypothetical protein